MTMTILQLISVLVLAVDLGFVAGYLTARVLNGSKREGRLVAYIELSRSLPLNNANAFLC